MYGFSIFFMHFFHSFYSTSFKTSSFLKWKPSVCFRCSIAQKDSPTSANNILGIASRCTPGLPKDKPHLHAAMHYGTYHLHTWNDRLGVLDGVPTQQDGSRNLEWTLRVSNWNIRIQVRVRVRVLFFSTSTRKRKFYRSYKNHMCKIATRCLT